VTFDPELPALQPYGYDQPGTEPLDLHNNGHTGKSLGSTELQSPVQILEDSGERNTLKTCEFSESSIHEFGDLRIGIRLL
jgi:hypothetical protein